MEIQITGTLHELMKVVDRIAHANPSMKIIIAEYPKVNYYGGHNCAENNVDNLQISNSSAKRPCRVSCDDELTLGDLALYEAGRLRVYFHLVDVGFFTMEQVAEIMEIIVDDLNMIRRSWSIDGSITAQRDAIIEIALRDANSGCEKELSSFSDT